MDSVVERTSTPVTDLKTTSVDLEVVQFLINVLSGGIAECSISRQDPNVLRVEHTTQETVGAGINDCEVSVISVKDGCQGSLEGKSKSISNRVMSMFSYILDESISIHCYRKTSPGKKKQEK